MLFCVDVMYHPTFILENIIALKHFKIIVQNCSVTLDFIPHLKICLISFGLHKLCFLSLFLKKCILSSSVAVFSLQKNLRWNSNNIKLSGLLFNNSCREVCLFSYVKPPSKKEKKKILKILLWFLLREDDSTSLKQFLSLRRMFSSSAAAAEADWSLLLP